MSQTDNQIYINNFNNINNIILYDDYLINNYHETTDVSWEIDRNPDFTLLNDYPNYDAFNINEQIDLRHDDFIPFETEPLGSQEQVDIIVGVFPVSEEDTNCCICIESRENSQICQLNCCHKFCYSCILTHIRRNRIRNCCPLCRSNITNIIVQSEEIRDQFI